ncbi:MAG: RIO1 family regulatory kinase/ATPase [Halobacteriales archaeon]
MDLRGIARGTLDWEQLEAVATTLARRHGREEVHVEFPDADNWLSIPMVVDGEWFVKVVTPQNSLFHAVLTGARNLGTVAAGTEQVFDHFGTPLAMAEHELEATRRMRAAGVAAPDPVEAFEVDGLGVLVLEYLPAFRPLDAVARDRLDALAEDLFANLARLPAAGGVPGDLRAENVLLQDGDLYFIDATAVRSAVADADSRGIAAGEAYDLACALAMLAPRLGTRRAVEAARSRYADEALLSALSFLDFVDLRPDHDFDAAGVKLEIERATA